MHRRESQRLLSTGIKENADAIMNSNEQLMETFEHLENKLKESNDFIIESQKNVIYDNLKDIMEKQQVLSDSIKDMEIRRESGNHSKSYSVYSKC